MINPDLSDTWLSGLRLGGINFSRCNLIGSHLNRTDLRDANLYRANLSNASVQRADLSGANCDSLFASGINLMHTNMQGARLESANLTIAHLTEANFDCANLAASDLSKCIMYETKLHGASLHAAKLTWSALTSVDLRNAVLRRADLTGASLIESDLSGSDISLANLRYARLIDTNLTRCNLTGCRVYGIAAWNLTTEQCIESDLTITPVDELTITVDKIELAQFIYLLLNNKNFRAVVDTVASKLVLILGRFTEERLSALNAIRDALRDRNYVPVLFDFTGSSRRDLTETISTLAHLARFIIADITDAKSIPQELMAVVPSLPSVPVQPLRVATAPTYGMFDHFRRFPWVLEPAIYSDVNDLVTRFDEIVVRPAETVAKQLSVADTRHQRNQ